MNGLFAGHGLDVEILDPSGGPDNVVRVASGESDFALTSVQHYLSARVAHGPLAARFVAIVVQHSPIGALVAASSELRAPENLAGRRVGADPENPQVAEFMASLAHRGIAPPVLVAMEHDSARQALSTGEVDAIVALVDALPRRRRQAGIELRPIRVGLDEVYGSGLVAGDHVDRAAAGAVRDAVVEALEAQRRDPTSGLATMAARYADDRTDDAVEGWRLLEPFVFGRDPLASMDTRRWRTTLDFLGRARGIEVPEPESVFRAEMALSTRP